MNWRALRGELNTTALTSDKNKNNDSCHRIKEGAAKKSLREIELTVHSQSVKMPNSVRPDGVSLALSVRHVWI